MKRPLFLQSLRKFGLGGGGILVVIFLLLPYLIDFAYCYGDFGTPDFAQRNFNDGRDGEEDRYSGDTKSLGLADGQATSPVALDILPPDVCRQLNHPRDTITAPDCLSVASLTSRPPPTL